MNLAGKRVVVYDLETNGFSPTGDRPIQVAAMVQHGVTTEHHQWFVACPHPLPDKIVELTGITDQHLIGGATLADTARRLYQIIAPGPDLVLIGHNILRFDNAFVEHLWRVHLGIDCDLAPHCWDTLAWTRAERHNLFVPEHAGAAWQKSVLFQRLTGPKCDLKSACEHYGVVADGFHQAQNDVAACWAIAQQQMRLAAERQAGRQTEAAYLASTP